MSRDTSKSTEDNGSYEGTNEIGRFVVVKGPRGDLCIQYDKEGHFLRETWKRPVEKNDDDTQIRDISNEYRLFLEKIKDDGPNNSQNP